MLVIGGGQAGIASAYELRRRGFAGYAKGKKGRGTFAVLDAEVRPGGAWQHRWPSLTMETVNHIADLPGLPVGEFEPKVEAAQFVPTYFTDFEDAFDLPILRPAMVFDVEDAGDPEEGIDGDGVRRLRVNSSIGTWLVKAVINCTGTWTRPFIPFYKGADTYRGQQFHTQSYPGAAAFRGKRVLIVGGGISALGHLDEVSQTAKSVVWATRTPPRWKDVGFVSNGRGLTAEIGMEIEKSVRARVEAGLRPRPVVAETGLPINDMVRAMRARGVLDRKPMFDRLDTWGAWWGDDFEEFDAIIWATGFRAELRHLAPLKLRSKHGGVTMVRNHSKVDPRVHLVGYGPSASTVGARWAARNVVADIIKQLDR